jgi:hypothetical protein
MKIICFIGFLLSLEFPFWVTTRVVPVRLIAHELGAKIAHRESKAFVKTES